ncbi:LacI family DNA-binding transcriptional regulator [Jeotgalibacillus sp. S-D1]|uniref:LacI family DNA-binding transcriptional regulator n=1 Tax=Jeotgalibacillus sp. S-D1 TaxID=2552189 RepID=UPI0014044A93|nr:LacI family DNA-binding transcriptional regulator [Jeotgalibacillus sp. S-D1]
MSFGNRREVIGMATIQDIAKMAGVSVATVSHVVNQTRYVSPDTVKKVEDVINSVDELPKFIVKKQKVARSNGSKNVFIYVTNSSNLFQSQLVKIISSEVSKIEGAKLVTIYTDDVHEALKSNQIITNNNCIGQILLVNDEIKKSLKPHPSMNGIPIVLVSENYLNITSANTNSINHIVSDTFNGCYHAINHFVNNGHEKIALLNNGDQTLAKNNSILCAYKEALETKGISMNESYIPHDLMDEHSIREYLHSLLFGFDPPSAIFITSESALISTLKFMSSNNLNCPDDLSIICLNEACWFELFSPPITSVKQNVEVIAKKVLEVICMEENEGSSPSFEENLMALIPTNLSIRSSTAGIARGPFGEKASGVDILELSVKEKNEIKERNLTAVISFHYMGAAWMELHEQGIKDVFLELGISLLAITNAHFDPEMQSKQLLGLLALDPDIIIAIPVENKKTSSAFKKIAKSNSKLVLITNVPDGLTPKDYVSCVSVNEWSHGRIAGSGLGNNMRKFNKKNIGMLVFDADFYATNQRDSAVKQILLEEFPDLTIKGEIGFKDENDVYQKTIELLEKHTDIEGLYISWDGPAMKATEALLSMGRSDIIIGTADLDYPLALKMAKGEYIKSVSSQRPYEQGQAIALVAANALLNKTVPKFIGVEPLAVSNGNLIKNWKTIFKENAPEEMVALIKNNRDL